MQRSACLLMGVRLAGSPPTGSVLNGPGRRNLALRNGGQFSWSTRRRGAKAVCESLCSLLLRGGSPLSFCSRALERWVLFPAPTQVLLPQSLRFAWEDMDDTATVALAVARAVLCSSRGDLGGLGCSFAPRDRHCTYTSAKARGSHATVPAVQQACNATRGSSGL